MSKQKQLTFVDGRIFASTEDITAIMRDDTTRHRMIVTAQQGYVIRRRRAVLENTVHNDIIIEVNHSSRKLSYTRIRTSITYSKMTQKKSHNLQVSFMHSE